MTADAVVTFWEKAGPKAWYQKNDAFDAQIRERFLAHWEEAEAGGLTDWPVSARDTLGLIILLDQFPRNMFRGEARAFATDARALVEARRMLDEGWDLDIEEPLRQFVYMPYMHSEDPADQDRSCALMETRMTEGNNAEHAHAHRMIIDRFGRFPYRNEALGRENTPDEKDFIDNGGYGAIMKQLQSARG